MKLESMTEPGRAAFRATLEAVACDPGALDDYDLAAHYDACKGALAACKDGNWVLTADRRFMWLDDVQPYAMSDDDIARHVG